MKSLNKTILAFPLILLCLTAVFAVCGGTVQAAEYGDFEVIGGKAAFDEGNGILTVSGVTTIKNKNESVPTTQRIVVADDAEVTLVGVNIDASGQDGSALSIAATKSLTLILLNGRSNVLISSGDYAGLHVPSTSRLTIEGPGSLEAKCLSDIVSANGAGIGGNGTSDAASAEAGGAVTIEGGTVTAMCSVLRSGNANGAGIGGGGSLRGAGGGSGTVTINGGTVRASSNLGKSGYANGAGIGGGGSYTGTGGAGGTVIIDGGNVIAEGGEKQGAENIGHGRNGTGSGTLKNSAQKELVLVSMSLNKSHFLTELWAGGYKGDAMPDAANKKYGIKDIKTFGSGLFFYLPNDLEEDDFVLVGVRDDKDEKTIYTGKIETIKESTARGVEVYNGIDLSWFPSGQHLFIGNSRFAISQDSNSNTVDYTGNYTLRGGSAEVPIAHTVTVLKDYKGMDSSRTITLSGLNIDVSNDAEACAFAIEAGAQVSMQFKAVNRDPTTSLISGANRAGLNVPAGASLEITTNGYRLNAVCKATKGDAAGAGIGGNKGQAGGEVTIKGVDPNATVYTYNGGVTAICHAENDNAGGAGIGGGAGGDSGKIIIEGSTIIAGCESPNGTATGAGIGGGENGNGGTVIIDGGSVKSVGGASAENIGRGRGGRDSGSLKNSAGNDVYLNTLSINLPSTSYSNIRDIRIDYKMGRYGIGDVNLLDITGDNIGKFYFYLPPSTKKEEIYISLNISGSVLYNCTRSYTRKDSHMSEGETVLLLEDTPYIVNIPSEISFDSLSYKKSGAADKYSLKSFEIRATGLGMLVDGRSLSVRVSSPDNEFTLTGARPEQKLEYQVFEGKDLTDFSHPLKQNDAAVQGFTKEFENMKKYATLRLDQSQLQYSGDYTGTLTFTVNIDDIIE